MFLNIFLTLNSLELSARQCPKSESAVRRNHKRALWILACISAEQTEATALISFKVKVLNLLRDLLLSYCPEAIRRKAPPSSSLVTLRASIWSGLAQQLLAGLALLLGFRPYFVWRAHSMATQIAGSNETGQTIAVVVIVFEYLLHPLSLLLLYLAIEGFIRFVGGLVTGEVVPSLAVSLFFQASSSFVRLRAHRTATPPVADLLEHLPEGRVRIASAEAKAQWNASLTIGLDGQWFEVEREETGNSLRPFVYILRPVPPGKILRRYEEYCSSAALSPDKAESFGQK